jgi:hypothetical protein
MRRTSTLALGATMLGALAFVAAGCGGGSKEAASTTTEQTVPTATETPTTTEAPPPTTTAVTTRPATQTTGKAGVVSAKDCRAFNELGRQISAAQTGAGSGVDLKKQAAIVKEFADRSPRDVRADFQLFATYMGKVADAYGDLKPGQQPDAATLARLQKVSAEVDVAKVTAALQRITSWLQSHCKG